jgi:hypothetical protein
MKATQLALALNELLGVAHMESCNFNSGIKLRNTLPPLASNDLFGGGLPFGEIIF